MTGETAPKPLRLALPDEAATRRLAADLGRALKAGDLVSLEGELGAGKSTLARALLRHLADDPALEVPSPTYTLVQPYEECRPPAVHADLYRLADPAEVEELGLLDGRGTCILLVEWLERAGGRLGVPDLTVALAPAGPEGEAREATISGAPEAMARLERSLAIRRFLGTHGLAAAERRHLTGDASARAYETVSPDTGAPPLVLMDAPARPPGPVLRDGLPYTRLAHIAEDVAPFVAVGTALREAGFSAPAIHAADLDAGLLLLEDLGSEGIVAEGRPMAERYLAAAEFLAAFHARPWSPDMTAAPGRPHRVPPFDDRAKLIEVEVLVDWYVPRHLGRAASDEERARFQGVWRDLFRDIADGETSLTLRDFHSPNILWQAGETGARRIGLIDFQDAMMGPSAYDLASLAQDARVDVPAELEMRLVSVYRAAREAREPGFDAFRFERDYAVMAAQRATKILGLFVRLDVRDGKPHYLRHLPRIRDYMRRSLSHPTLAPLAQLYADWRLLDAAPGAERP